LAKDAVKPLTLLLKDADPMTRALAADALGRFAGDAKDSIAELLPLLKDPEKSVKLAAVFAIGRVQPDDTAPAAAALIEVFKSSNEMDMRREALVALGLLGDHSADTLKTLTTILGDDKEEVELRRTAIVALSRFGPAVRPAEAELKAAMTKDKDKVVRLNAVRALVYGFGADKKELLPFLVERLKPESETDFEVRVAVAEELGGLGMDGKPAISALRSAQRDPQIKVRDAATAAIKAIEKPPAPPKDAP
jgi:HEAT repeat protein